jgi:putative transposase
LKRLSGREKRFRQIENHRLNKTIVSLAKDTNRGIALENLKGIRTRIEKRFRKVQRAKISGWSFYQLKEMIAYKSKLRGVPVFFVDPKYTSQTCSACGHCEKASRKSQSEFECVKCNHSLNADFNAALNIRGKAIVTVTQKSENIVLSNAMQVQV